MSTLTLDTPVRATPTASRRSWTSDVWLVMTRELRPVVREPFSVVFGLVQPLVFLALFGPLLAGPTDLPAEDVWQWFVPAILVMTTLFGTSITGSNLQVDMQTGAHERLLVTPLSRSSQLVGRRSRRSCRSWRRRSIVIARDAAVRVPRLDPRRRARARDARGARRRARVAQLRARDRGAQAGVDVLGRPADRPVPAADPLRDAPAASSRGRSG